MEDNRTFASSFYNAVTYLGVLIAVLVFVVEIFLFAIDFFSGQSNLYLGLITYLVLPAFLFLGLALIPLGVIWKRNRIKKGLPLFEFRRFRIDLALPTHRNALLVFIVGTAILVMMSMVGSYQAYEYTESVAFCGTMCHSVMHPEHTAYQNSPHGKVKCVDCHIGPGADWFVKAKLSGLRQVYRTALSNYNRPIKTPIENLRPARETCLQCHFPGKFFGSVELRRTYFLAEQDNKQWNLRMLLRIGAGKEQAAGVHAHMNVQNDIYYAAEDDRRQKITWVKSVDAAGKEVIYVTKTSKFKDTPPPADQIRKMDCVDCHNRPTHQMMPPDRLINDAMARGEIDSAIPQVKDRALRVMGEEYASKKEALEKIRPGFLEFYKTNHAEFYRANAEKVERAASAIEVAFANNIFPDMKARWDAFPDNIGHLNSRGCFRCHDAKHRSAEGATISRECRSCHTIIEQGPVNALERNVEGLEFKHPDGSDDWQTQACTDCHTGAAM